MNFRCGASRSAFAIAVTISVASALPVAAFATTAPAEKGTSAAPAADTAKVCTASVAQLIATRRLGYDLTYVARTTLARDLPAWRVEAGKGNPSAQLILGLCNYYGLGGPANAERGRKLLQSAADAGHAEAMAVLSILLRNGTLDSRPDVDQANMWLGKAVARHSAIGRDEVSLAAAKELLIDGKVDEAMKAYETGLKTGNLSAQVELAGITRREWLLRDSIPDSMRMLEDAAKRGHIGAMVELGKIYSFGRYVQFDAVKAKRWLDAAAATGDPHALFAAARAYESGRMDVAAKIEVTKANELWAKLAANGDPFSSLELYRAQHEVAGTRVLDDAAGTKLLIDAATRGVPEAYTYLSAAYINGERGFTKNVQLGIRLLDDGVAANDPTSVYQRACAYRFGYAGAPDEEKARPLFFAAARMGLPRAMTSVALRYMTGRGVKADPRLGHLCYLAAAREGHVEAMVQVASDFESGSGVKPDPVEAERWAKWAIAAGFVDAYHTLSLLAGERLAAVQSTPLPAKAIALLEAGVAARSLECTRFLGNYLVRGNLVPLDVSRGLKLLEAAAAKDEFGDTNLALGDLHLKGVNIPADTRQAMLYYRAAADRGNADGWDRMGRMHRHGEGVPVNPTEAIRCYEKGLALGSSSCAYALGICALAGEFVPKNIDRGLALMQQAADGQELYAFGVLAEYALGAEGRPVDEAAGLALAERGCQLGDGRAAWIVGAYFDKKQAYEKAMEWYRRGADLREGASLNSIGVLYRFGRGVAQDLDQAAKYYKLAADAGVADGAINYAWCLEFGHGVPMDKGEAFRMVLKLAIAGNPEGMFHAGRMYFDGLGIQKDQKAGAEWLLKAAAAGEPRAISIVAVMRDKGLIK